jgi:uncharacterized metal-binding protein YceD (DUF177 family)
MNESIPLRRPGAEIGDRHEVHADFPVESFDLYGRHHEVTHAEADVAVTRLAEGLHLDLKVTTDVLTTCDRTLEPTEVRLEFGDSEFLPGPDNPEVSVEDWTLDLTRYTQRALPTEIPCRSSAQAPSPCNQRMKATR